MEVRINSNFRSLGLWLSDIERTQLPFATAKALTYVARDASIVVKREVRQRFTLRNRYTEKGITWKKAIKRDWPSPFSIVGVDERRSYLADHVEGATRKPTRAPMRAVPGIANKRTSRGKIRRADRAYRSLREPAGRGKKKHKAFIRRNMILRRAGRGGRDLKVLHILVPEVKVKQRLPLVDTASRVVSRRFGAHFKRELAAAVKSSGVRRSFK